MTHNYIKKYLSMALLVAFSFSNVIALATEETSPYTQSMVLSGNASLTNNNHNITLSLRDSDVKQVLRMFADKAGLNIVFHSSVSGNVTLDLVNMPINNAFDLVLQIANLNYYKQNNTLIIIAKDNADNAAFSKQEMLVFPVKYVSASKIANFLNTNVFGMRKAGMSGVDAATVNAATNEIIVFGMKSDVAIVQKVIDQLDREPLSKTFAVNHTTPAEMADMICNFLLPSSGAGSEASSGGGFAPASPGVGTTGGAAGIITGGAASTGSSGDIKLGEGVVACTISQGASSSVATAFDLQNLAVSYYPQRGTVSVLGGSQAQINMVEKFIRDNDVKQPQAYLEVSIVELNEDGSKEFSNNWSIQSKAWGVKFDGSSTSGGREGGMFGKWMEGTLVDNSQTGKWTYNSETGEATYTPPQLYETPWKWLMPNTTYVSWTMNYLIENKKARVLANPKLLITNGQESIIDLTQDYVEKVTSEFISSTSAGQGATGAVQRTYSIGKDQGIKVTLTPFISPEGYVTLNIQPDYSTIAGQVYANGETGQSELQATLLSRRNLELKNVRIKDGETLVIGGLIQENEAKTVAKIPVLGDLPVIGSIFRSTKTAKSKSELVIMLTPKIINDGVGTVADSL